jgi:hypothetical protein
MFPFGEFISYQIVEGDPAEMREKYRGIVRLSSDGEHDRALERPASFRIRSANFGSKQEKGDCERTFSLIDLRQSLASFNNPCLQVLLKPENNTGMESGVALVLVASRKPVA